MSSSSRILLLLTLLLTYSSSVMAQNREDCPDGRYCLNGGKCISFGSNGNYNCDCKNGYSGIVCGVSPDYKDEPLRNRDGSLGSKSPFLKGIGKVEDATGLNRAQVIGISVGIILALVLCLTGICWCKCKRRRSEGEAQKGKSDEKPEHSDPTVSVDDLDANGSDTMAVKEEGGSELI